MNEDEKRVSVIVPTYKRQIKYLSRALQSIKSQTYKNVEIVVVDDNIPLSEYRMEVMAFMKQYETDPDVIYIMNEKNMGGALSRNNGIHVATGEYITFLDDDDEYLPNKIERQLTFMVEENYDMTFTDLKLVNEHKEIVDYREHSRLKSFDQETMFKYHIMRHLTGTPTFMYKAQQLRAIGGFDDVKMGQEFYLMLKSIENGLKIGYLKGCDILAYRYKGECISQGKSKIIEENKLYRFKKKYFSRFTLREQTFIRFRHYAVLVVVYKRNSKYIQMLATAIVMVISSPMDFCIEGYRYMLNLLRHKSITRKTYNESVKDLY